MVKKSIIMAAIAILAVGSITAFATESRIETLGGQGLYISDDTGQFTNPALISANRRMLLIHMGGYAGGDYMAYGGGNFAPMIKNLENLTVGFYVARDPSYSEGGIAFVTGDAIDSALGVFNNPWVPSLSINDAAAAWKNPFDIIFAYQLGNLSVGLSYYLANGKYKFVDHSPLDPSSGNIDDGDTETIESKARLHSVKIGAAYKMGKIEPQVWFHFNPYSVIGTYEYDDDGAGAGILVNDNFTSETALKGGKFVLGGRVFYPLNDNLTVVPAATWEFVYGQIKWNTHPDTILGPRTIEDDLNVEYSFNSILAGSALQYKNDKIFAVASASFKWSNYIRMETVYTDDWDNYESVHNDKYFAFPDVALGLEYKALAWLTLRSGIHTTAIWAKTASINQMTFDKFGTQEDDIEVTSVQDTTASVGVGLHFGNMTIDGTLGNHFLSNENGGSEGNLFSNLDVKYVY